MKTIFFIDGENFVYQLRDSLASRKLIRYRDELSRVNIRKLFENVLQDPSVRMASIRYYASKIHIIDKTPELKERTERYATDAAAWQKVLEAQKVEYIEAGHLLVRDGKPCVECGHREPVLVEKGVDVTIATDMIRSSGDNVRLVLLSSDGDLMPAVLESKRRGAELVYIGFRGVSNAALARTADKRLTITSKNAAEVLARAPKKDQSIESINTSHNHVKNSQAIHHHHSKSTPSVFTGSRLATMLPTLPSQAIDKIAKQPKPKTASKKKKPEDKQ
jgi:uncharacterized LabA/DUF88 family protein